MGQIKDDQFDTIFEVDTELNENNGLINNQQNFKFCPVSTGEVLKLLKKIPTGKAFGMDGINDRFLKYGANVLAKPLAFIFQLSLQSGIVPDEWKLAKVTPIHKGGVIHDPNQCRPVSVISTVMNIFECLAHNQFSHILTVN